MGGLFNKIRRFLVICTIKLSRHSLMGVVFVVDQQLRSILIGVSTFGGVMWDNCDSEDDDRLLHGGVNLVISSHTNTACVYWCAGQTADMKRFGY